MLKAQDCTLFSGGAAGTEEFFGMLAEEWQMTEVNYSFEGHQIERKRGVRCLTPEELALKDVSLTYVSRLMNREYTRAPLFRKVLQSICWQVSSGHQILVVGSIQPDNTVKGGTGWGYNGLCFTKEKDFLDRIGGQTALFASMPELAGWCYTQLTDVEQEQNGVYTYDRRPKAAPKKLAKLFGARPSWSAW